MLSLVTGWHYLPSRVGRSEVSKIGLEPGIDVAKVQLPIGTFTNGLHTNNQTKEESSVISPHGYYYSASKQAEAKFQANFVHSLHMQAIFNNLFQGQKLQNF